MNFQAFSLPLFLLFLFKISPSFSFNNNPYTNCTSIFSCGIITNLGFPFWGQTRPEFCGHPKLKLTCDNEITKIEIAEVKYRVLEVNLTARILRIARDDYSNGICPKTALVNTTLDPDMFEILPGYGNLTLFYGCDSLIGKLKFECAVYGKGGVWSCRERVEIPVRGNGDYLVIDALKMEEAIRDGFEVKWKVDDEYCEECVKSSGVCVYDFKMNRSICFCQNQDSSSSSSSSGIQACWNDSDDKAASVATSGRNGPKRSRLIIGLVIGGAGILGLFLGYLIFHISCRRKKHMMKLKSKDLSSSPSSADIPTPSTFLSPSIPSFPYSRSDLEKGSSYFGAQVFTYTELEKATSNFDRSRELGDGGYGTVYAGKLHDGRIVAVKRLYENNYKRVEQFMNEVEILSQLQHPNLVKLYGCTSRHSRELLLVYEYIPNGTVADHLHGKQANSGLLSWSVRLRIAIETATALAYLHRKDIIHRDVKTNNILLDNNFQVKVADFGLSRLFPNDVTHVSTAPQGTPGYVDPEYYQCYQLTNKSDVYSFGVVLVELISSLQAVDINRNRNDINLCNMAVNRIQNHALHELVDPNIGFERDYAVRCMITSVAELAFRCLRQAPILRPSMDEVLDVLRGIENEELGARKAEVLDIGSDDVRLLR